VNYSGTWNWPEYFQTFSNMDGLLKMVDHAVYTIHKVETFPKGPVLHQVGTIVKNTPDKIAIGIVVPSGHSISNAIIAGMLRVVTSTFDSKGTIKFAPSLEEALAMIEQIKQDKLNRTILQS
jgi:hypothetical protein